MRGAHRLGKLAFVTVLGLSLLLGCSDTSRRGGSGGDDGGSADAARDGGARDAGHDARTGTDAFVERDAGAGTDAFVERDAGAGTDADIERDAGTDHDAGGGALDSELATAGPEGTPCDTPGSLGECTGVAEVCRFHSASAGRCGSCDVCGNLGDPCTTPTDCDILFACFRGECTNYCTLGSSECGPVEDCLDVGHPDEGVCRP